MLILNDGMDMSIPTKQYCELVSYVPQCQDEMNLVGVKVE